jgi:isocitrate dehydrogenase kinase/phosphatase
MKSIYNIYEASILDIDGTIEDGDKLSEDMFKLQWGYAYLNNLPNKNDRAIVGGMRGIYRKYFNRSVPELFTDRHSTLETLLKKPERKHKLNKLDTDGDYIASYMLQCELDKLVNNYDFVSNKSDIEYLTEKITEHMHKILNNDGKKSLQFKVRQYYRGGSAPIISIAMETIYDSDFKMNVPRHNQEIMCFNFTKGQYYYK